MTPDVQAFPRYNSAEDKTGYTLFNPGGMVDPNNKVISPGAINVGFDSLLRKVFPNLPLNPDYVKTHGLLDAATNMADAMGGTYTVDPGNLERGRPLVYNSALMGNDDPNRLDKNDMFEQMLKHSEQKQDKAKDSMLGRVGTGLLAVEVGKEANKVSVNTAMKAFKNWNNNLTKQDSLKVKKLIQLAKKKGYSVHKGPTPGVLPLTPGRLLKHAPKKVINNLKIRAAKIHGIKPHKNSRGALFLPKKTPPAVAAHELGHVLQGNSIDRGLFRVINGLPLPLKSVAALINADHKYDQTANITAGGLTTLEAPTIINELDASAKGYKLLRNMGSSRLHSLRSFSGVPSYLSLAAVPGAALGLRKLRQMAIAHHQNKIDKSKKRR